MQYYFLFGLQMKHLTATAAGAACGEEGNPPTHSLGELRRPILVKRVVQIT